MNSNNVFGVSSFVPVMPSSGIFSPSGALTPADVGEYQSVLVALGHMPASGITRREPIASASVIRAFQQNYNAENRCRRHEPGASCQPGRSYGPPLLPARLSEDGRWGPNTQQALSNYISFARETLPLGGRTTVSTVIPGVSITPIGPQLQGQIDYTKSSTPSTDKVASPSTEVTPVAPSPGRVPAASAQTPASLPGAGAGAGGGAASAEIPWVPISIVAVGVLAIGGALYVRSSRKGRK